LPAKLEFLFKETNLPVLFFLFFTEMCKKNPFIKKAFPVFLESVHSPLYFMKPFF